MSKSIKSFFKPKSCATAKLPAAESEEVKSDVNNTETSILGKRSSEIVVATGSAVLHFDVPNDDAHKRERLDILDDNGDNSAMMVPSTSWIPVDQLQSWVPILQKEFIKPYFARLDLFLEREAATKKIFPPRELVFSAFSACAFEDIKVVVIGQDPYHGPNQAHGLAFSVMKPERPPPSLKNIFKEAKNDVPKFSVPSHGDLSGWSQQGVFLLNTCLTVQQGNANSHQKQGWEEFITAVIKAIDQRDDKIVFLLWGKPANERCTHINRTKHTVISSSHPSPLGATKTSTPFIGSRCFSRCNEALVAAGKTPINWNL